MEVKNTVKVMNFHALLRVNNARRRVDDAFRYEREVFVTLHYNTNLLFVVMIA